MVGCQHVAPAPVSASQNAAALLGRSLVDPGLREFLEACRGRPVPEWPLQRWDLEQLTIASVYTQTSLGVTRAHQGVAEAGITTAAERPNPTLSLSPELSANPGLGVSPWLATVQLDWPIETAGKRDRRIERAEALTEVARLAIPVEAWRLRLQLRTALADFVAARARESALAEELAEQRRRSELLAQRLEAGAASQLDASFARVARMQAEVDLADARRQRLDAVARVAAAIGVPDAALAGVELDFPLAPGPEPLLMLDGVEARRAALHERWDVRAALADYAVSEATLRLELARQYPDIHIGRGYQFDEGQNKWALAITLDLPILNRNGGPIAEAVAGRDEMAARMLATQARALAEVELALAHRQGAVAEEREMQTLVGEQTQRLERTHTVLRLGATDGLALADAAIERWRAERARIDAQARVQQSLAELEAAVQGPSAFLDRASGMAGHAANGIGP